MFKVLVLQALYNLSDDQAASIINDRLSFMRVLGLGLGDAVPDAKTIWLFREPLPQARAVDNPFTRFDRPLTKAGYLAMGGQIGAAPVVAAPKQRNTNGEKADIKADKVPNDWRAKPAKLAQKDRDVRWTMEYSRAKPKGDGSKQVDIAVPTFGDKTHIQIDRHHGLIGRWKATDAARYDGAQLSALVDKTNTASGVWAYTACRSKKNGVWLARNVFVSNIHTQEAQRQADVRARFKGQRQAFQSPCPG